MYPIEYTRFRDRRKRVRLPIGTVIAPVHSRQIDQREIPPRDRGGHEFGGGAWIADPNGDIVAASAPGQQVVTADVGDFDNLEFPKTNQTEEAYQKEQAEWLEMVKQKKKRRDAE